MLLVICSNTNAQNLPSLLLEKNINATFSILAYDAEEKEWGIAVATNNIYVGNSTIYIKPGVGAFSVIAETEPQYAINGFKQLKDGKTIENAINFSKTKDSDSHYRQVAGIDAFGNTYAFSGDALKHWKGTNGFLYGKNYVVLGNQLGDNVLTIMADTFENSRGTLAQRLLASLLAGQRAGGQITGKLSTALVVKGTNNEWYNQIDLRVDYSKTPFQDLQKLLNYHEGRIRINQTLYAIRENNRSRATRLLEEAESLLKGWDGMYSKIVVAYLLIGNKEKAVTVIKKALAENSKWKEILPTFYYLKEYDGLKQEINEELFSLKDWNNAIHLLLQIKEYKKCIDLAHKIIKTNPESSYTYYLLGKAYLEIHNSKDAKIHLKKAILHDPSNVEAKRQLSSLSKK